MKGGSRLLSYIGARLRVVVAGERYIEGTFMVRAPHIFASPTSPSRVIKNPLPLLPLLLRRRTTVI